MVLENGDTVQYTYLCVCTGASVDAKFLANSTAFKTADFSEAFEDIRADRVRYKYFIELCERHYAHETIAYVDKVAALFETHESLRKLKALEAKLRAAHGTNPILNSIADEKAVHFIVSITLEKVETLTASL